MHGGARLCPRVDIERARLLRVGTALHLLNGEIDVLARAFAHPTAAALHL
jgi:hypothetical protein